MMYDSDLVRVKYKYAVEDSAESPPEGSRTSSRPSSPPLPPSPPLPSTSPSLGEPTPERNLNLAKDILRRIVKTLNTWVHQEMPDEVHGQCQELVNESVNQIRALLDEAMVPGDFTFFGRAKGSNSRVSHSITKNKSLRGAKTVAGKDELSSRLIEKKDALMGKPKLPRWDTLETLGETTSLP
jgi:hypothetical protein